MPRSISSDACAGTIWSHFVLRWRQLRQATVARRRFLGPSLRSEPSPTCAVDGIGDVLAILRRIMAQERGGFSGFRPRRESWGSG